MVARTTFNRTGKTDFSLQSLQRSKQNKTEVEREKQQSQCAAGWMTSPDLTGLELINTEVNSH